MPPEQRLKVAMVVPVGRSGYLPFSLSLCEALSRAGADATLITSRDCDELPEHENGYRIRPVLGGMNRDQSKVIRGLSYGVSLLSLRSVLRRERFDVAHFQDTFVPYVDAPFFMLNGNGRPATVFTAHDPDQEAITARQTRRVSLRRVALGRIYHAVDGLVALSEIARKELIAGFAVPEAKVARIGQGNYFSCGVESAPPKGEARRRLGIEGDRKLVLFFGSLKPSKGLDFLIRAFARVKAVEPKAFLLIAGETRGVDVAECRSLIDRLGLTDSASLRPDYVAAEALPDYLVAADLVALPYLRIYQSGVLHLAYSFGRPVVATRVGGLAEDVQEGKSGLLVPPADEESLAGAILELIAAPDRLAAMGDYAKSLAETVYSWDAIARQTLDFYASLLARKAA